MLLGALVLALLNPAPPAPQSRDAGVSVQTACLKTCAGAPKDAQGAVLLECLRSCEPMPLDGGVH